MSRATIHLGVHNHLVANGKCRKSIKETKRLIGEEVDCMLNAKISSSSLSASKTFLVSYLFDDFNDGIVELFKGKYWNTSRTSSVKLTLPTFITLLLLSNII
jgi:hypothetical protein